MRRSADPTAPGRGGDDDRAARWTIRLLAGSVFVAVVAVVLRISLGSLAGDPGPGPRPAPDRARGGAAGVVDDLGPAPGTDLEAYAAGRRQALAAMAPEGERAAVVSFGGYLTGAEARARAGPLEVVAFLVAGPGTGPATVADPRTWWRDQTRAMAQERDEIRRLIPTVTDAAFKAFYEAEAARLDAAVGALGPDAAVVYAVVVRGPVAGLQALSARPDVRLVDAATGARPAAGVQWRGLRPEEKIRAGEPPTRPG